MRRFKTTIRASRPMGSPWAVIGHCVIESDGENYEIVEPEGEIPDGLLNDLSPFAPMENGMTVDRRLPGDDANYQIGIEELDWTPPQ